jgi:hypothetical protein
VRRDRIAEPWSARTPYGRGDRWPERIDSCLADGLAPDSVYRWVQSGSGLAAPTTSASAPVGPGVPETIGGPGVSVDWELLSQGAQAATDERLLELAQRCHPETLRQVRWANAMLNELAPQTLTS